MKTNTIGRLREQGYEGLNLSIRDGTLNDASRNILNGTFVGNARIIKSENGMSLWPNGGSVTLSDSPVFFANQSPYSVVCWTKRYSINDAISPKIFGQWSNTFVASSWFLGITNANYLSLGNCDGVATGGVSDNTTQILTNRWYFLSGVYTGGVAGTNGYLYVNGIFVFSGTVNRAAQDVATVPRIGNNNIGSEPYNGLVDTILYYQNYALNATEIAQIMAETRPWG